MSTFNEELLQKARSSYQRLTIVASNLNAVSDEMGSAISLLDDSLKKLNLGIEAWHRFYNHEDEQGVYYSYRSIGYAKLGPKWGIALKRGSGNEFEPEHSSVDEWLFNDAPRQLRLESIEYIPQLIDELIKDAESTIERVREKANATRTLAQALAPAAPQQALNSKVKAGKANG